MPTYKLPSGFHPAQIADLKVAYTEAVMQWHLCSAQPAKMWTTIGQTIKEVLYVRGMNHEIVDALTAEWNREASQSARRIKQEREKRIQQDAEESASS